MAYNSQNNPHPLYSSRHVFDEIFATFVRRQRGDHFPVDVRMNQFLLSGDLGNLVRLALSEAEGFPQPPDASLTLLTQTGRETFSRRQGYGRQGGFPSPPVPPFQPVLFLYVF